MKKDKLNEDAMEISQVEESEIEEEEVPYDLETLEVVSMPQCVECPHNLGAITCAVFGNKPSGYMSNLEKCPREKK